MKSAIFALIIFIPLLGFSCSHKTNNTNNEPIVIDKAAILLEAKQNGLIMNENETVKMTDPTTFQTIIGTNIPDTSKYVNKDFIGWKSAALADVTEGGSFGLAFSKLEKNTHTIVAKFGNLPELESGYYYECWLVKRGSDLKTVSIGKVEQGWIQYAKVFQSKTDLSDFDFFVLTLEADDANPSPAKHILEGAFK